MGGFFSALGGQLLEVALPMLATTIATLAVGILAKFLKRQNLELTKEQEARLKELVTQAVKATEEAAHREKLTSVEKRSLAFSTVVAQAPDANPAKVELLMDSALVDVRSQAARA